MNLKKYVIEGTFQLLPNSDDFALELTILSSSLKIKGLSKQLLIEN